MDTLTQDALRAIANAHRSLADELDRLLSTASAVTPIPRGSEWDPEHDAPLLPPQVRGTQAERDWSTLTYLSGLYAINRRHNRGASAAEVREYALKAGYGDGRAVTAWSKGNGSTQNDSEKRRWITARGLDLVRDFIERYGVVLPDDLSGPWDAPDFVHVAIR